MKKKLALILFLLPLLAGGVVVTLALTRVINIPGLTPKKKKKPTTLAQNDPKKDLAKDGNAKDGSAKDASAKDPETDKASGTSKVGKPSASTKPPTPKAPPKQTPATEDLDKGATKLAAVWAEMKPDDLVKIIPNYKDSELALVLKKMDESAVAELLAKLKPERAATLSRAIEVSAGQLKSPAAAP
jgi:hypothetical protein